MSTQLCDSRNPTDDELSFEQLASEIERLWRSERPELAKPVPIPVGGARAAPKVAASPIIPRRGLLRGRPASPARPLQPAPNQSAAGAAAASAAPPVREPVQRAPAPRAPVEPQRVTSEPARGREPALLPLCRPDVKIMVGETVAVLNWCTHDDRPILMPIGLDGLEQLAHAVANALAEALAKDLRRIP